MPTIQLCSGTPYPSIYPLLTQGTPFWADCFNFLGQWSLAALLTSILRYKPQAFKPFWAQPTTQWPIHSMWREKGDRERGEKEICARKDMATLPIILKWASALQSLGTAAGSWMNFLLVLLMVHFCVGGLTGFEANSMKIFPVNEKLFCWGKTSTKKIINMANSSESGTFLSKIVSLWKSNVPSLSPIILTSTLKQLSQKTGGQMKLYHIKFAFRQWLSEVIFLWLDPCRRQQQYDSYWLEKSILSAIVRGPWLWHQNMNALQATSAVLAVCQASQAASDKWWEIAGPSALHYTLFKCTTNCSMVKLDCHGVSWKMYHWINLPSVYVTRALLPSNWWSECWLIW